MLFKTTYGFTANVEDVVSASIDENTEFLILDLLSFNPLLIVFLHTTVFSSIESIYRFYGV